MNRYQFGVCLQRAMLCALLLASAAAGAQTERMRVAVITDGPTDRQVLSVEFFRQAVLDTVAGTVDIEFVTDPRYVGDWTLRGVDAAIDRALAEPDVDVVLPIGILGSHQAATRSVLTKPVIAPMVIDPVLQGFPLASGVSGRNNFAYVADFHGIGNDVRAFQKIVRFGHLVAFVDEALLDALPELGDKAAGLAAELNTRITILRTGNSAGAALASIPADADAVYVTGLLRFSDAELRVLAEGLASRRLPSFSLIGHSELRSGLLMTAGGAERDNERLARRIVLMIQRIALGENPSTFDVSFPTEQRFTINMRVAQQIGFSPSWEFLSDAEQLDGGVGSDLPQLTLLDAMHAALDANPALIASGARRDSSNDEIGIARSNLLPQVDLAGAKTRIDADRATVLTQAEDSIIGSVSASQIVYSERAWASYSISRYLHEAAQQGYRQDTLDLLQSAATAYLDLLRAKSLESVRRSNVENTRRNLETSRVREQVGLSERSDYLRWVAELARDKQALLNAESSRHQAEINLMRIMHRPATQPFDTVESGIDSPLTLVSSPRTQAYIDTPAGWEVFTQYAVQAALQQAPEIAQSNSLVMSGQRSVTAARRAYYLPDLALVTSSSSALDEYGAGSGTLPGAPDDDSWSVSLQASWPLFAGGQRSAELSKARNELRASEADRSAAADFVEARVRIALHQTAASYPAIDLSKVAADAAGENLNMVTDAYGRGAVSVTELIDAQDTALEANLAAADAKYSFLIDFVDVLRAMSEFDILLDPLSREAWHDRVDDWFLTHAPLNRLQGTER
ncbi:MAG TPA: TolC family protein [Woeseiaceae bacterium]|nr:TolC family protein [Woeseiaceae bacterium]